MATGIPIELEQEYNRNKTLKQFFETHQLKVNSYVPVLDRQTIFLADLKDFETTMTGKDVTTTGVTDNKSTRKKQIARAYSIICLLTRSYALKYDKDELAANTNFPEYKINKMADGEILSFVTATNNRITAEAIPDPLFTPYAIDAARLAVALTKATEFNNLIGKVPAISSDVAAVIIELEVINDRLREDVNDFDLLMLHFKDTDTTFYNGYLSAKTIDDIGVHHAGIEGVATYDADFKPLEGVTVICNQNAKKKDTTDVVGHFEILQFKPDNYSFTFTHPKFGEKTVIVKIEKGRMKTVDVHWV